MLFHHQPHFGRGIAEGIPPEMLRLGIQFADGLKATNIGGFHHHRQPPDGPVMVFGGGGGGGGHWRVSQWVWPLPPPGPITQVCEWPAMNIPLTPHELDAKTIRDAAQRAQVIFSEDDLPEFPDENEDS